MALDERDTRDPRLEHLYREAALEAPPAHLDASILAAARREVGARPRALSAALRRWHVPVSIAAVIVVSVSLVILVKEEGGDRLGDARTPLVSAPADKPTAELTQAPPAAAASATAEKQVEAPAPVELRGSREDALRSVSKPAGTPPPAQERVAEPLRKPVPASPLRLEERAEAPASPDLVTAGRVGGASPAPLDQGSAVPAADAPRAKLMAQAILEKPAATDRPPVWQGLEKEPPEKWLARIEELMREGRAAEAEEMRVEFKRRFPGHPLGQASK